MTYFPPKDTTPPRPTKCPGCGKWHIPTPSMEMVSCCVLHPPGSCCHYSETEVPPPSDIVNNPMPELAAFLDFQASSFSVLGNRVRRLVRRKRK